MPLNPALRTVVVGLALAVCGCRSNMPQIRNAPIPGDTLFSNNGQPPKRGIRPFAEPAAPPERTLAQVLADVDRMDELTPDLQQQLKETLIRSKPSMWDPTISVYRSVASYRRDDVHRTVSAAPESSPIGNSEIQPASYPSYSDDSKPVPPPNAPQHHVADRVPVETKQPESPPEMPAPEPLSPQVNSAAQQLPERPVPTVTAVSYEVAEPSPRPPATDWRQSLDQAIAALEAAAQRSPSAADAQTIREQAALRLLYLAANRRADALQQIEGLATTEQEFWRVEIEALAAWLGDEKQGSTAPAGDRRAVAIEHLQRLAAEMAPVELLEIHNLKFCSEVQSYGVYQEIEANPLPGFKPAEEVLLYAEIEHFQSEPCEAGFCTRLVSRYRLINEQGECIASHDFPETTEYCKNSRRDFFMRYFIWIPEQVKSGNYTLELEIEDRISGQTAQASLQCTVR